MLIGKARKNLFTAILLISCALVFSQTYAQDTAERRSLRLLAAFQSLGHQSDRGELTGSTSRDRAEIKESINSVAWRLASIETLEAGCSYFHSTELGELDAERLAAFLADSDIVFHASRVDFYEERFERLSPLTKAKFSEISDTSRLFDRSTQVSEDRSNEFLALGADYLIERYSIFCETLPETRRIYESGEVSAVKEIVVRLGDQEDDK